MEPIIATVLQALSAGALAAATGVATDEVKSIYNELKTLIKQRWSGKPPAEQLLAEYEKNPESWEEVLAEKLKQSGIDQDNRIYQKAGQLLQVVNVSANVNQSRKASSGHTATNGATINQNEVTAGGNANNAGRDINQSTTHNRQTRLAVLLWLLALALTGVIGLGIYLYMTGRLQLPLLEQRRTLPSPSVEERELGSDSEGNKDNDCLLLAEVFQQMGNEINNTSERQALDYKTNSDIVDKYIGSMQALNLKDEKVKDYQIRFITLLRELSYTSRKLAGVDLSDFWAAGIAYQDLMNMDTYVSQFESLATEFAQFCSPT